jgi:hypothetical protein
MYKKIHQINLWSKFFLNFEEQKFTVQHFFLKIFWGDFFLFLSYLTLRTYCAIVYNSLVNYNINI